jgi:predicted phage terminase large subunit-like protein
MPSSNNLDEAKLIEALKSKEYKNKLRRDLDRFDSKKSLMNFIKLGWHTIEPGNELKANWGMEAICDHLEAVTRGEIRRLLINIPPGTSKSLTTNVFWPAWEWGPKGLSHYRYVNAAHEVNLAVRDNRRCKNLIQSDWYQGIWGDSFSFSADQNQKQNYENTKTGFRQSSPATSMTGKRGDRVIFDDPHSVSKAESEADRESVLLTFSEEVPTRLNKMAESAIIVIMQRVHERDVSGLILENEMGYEHLMIPMEFESDRRCYTKVRPSYIENPNPTTVYFNREDKVWRMEKPDSNDYEPKCEQRYNIDPRKEDGELLDPVRYPQKALDELKAALRAKGGTYAEAGQLQQRPAPRGGGMFKKSDFQYIDSIAGISGKVVRGWDLAASEKKTSPYTVGVKMMITTDGRIIIIDVNRFKKSPGKCEDDIKATAVRDGHSVRQNLPQDPGQAGKAQKAALTKLLHGFDVKFSPESGSKEVRAIPFAAQCEGLNVYLLRGHWNDAFINEAGIFPNGTFKDQIDAATRAYASLLAMKDSKISNASAPQEIEYDEDDYD